MTLTSNSLLPRNLRYRSARLVAMWTLITALPLCLQIALHRGAMVMSSLTGDNPTLETVGVVVTVTACSDFPPDAAAVLQYSILNVTSRFKYQFYAIHHPSALHCVLPLASLGFTLLEKDTPVNVSEIQGEYLRKRLPKSGCCGEKELIKFEAFRLTQHQAVILLDMDVLILKSLDPALDLILHNRQPNASQQLMWPDRALPADVWLVHTNDYAMVPPGSKIFPAQGGFSILKPNRTIYEDIKAIVRKGEFDEDLGWGNQTLVFWGSTTFQGLIPYYFYILNPGHAVELNWCLHNNMNSPPREPVKKGNVTLSLCYNEQNECEDCRDKRLEDVYSVHYTNCRKPWNCLPHEHENAKTQLCRAMHRRWFATRSEMEHSWGRSGLGNGTGSFESKFQGFCHEYNDHGYERIRQPYGRP